MIMKSSVAFFFAALLSAERSANGFVVIPTRNSNVNHNTVLAAATNNNNDMNREISRRVALVQSVAIATGVLSTASSAQAAVETLQAKVAQIEAENLAEVNTKGAPEKHLPKITVSKGSKVEVVIPHVMDPEKPHFIEYVWLQNVDTQEIVAAQAFSATDASPPTLVAKLSGKNKKASLKALSFCNLHGLWEGEVFSV